MTVRRMIVALPVAAAVLAGCGSTAGGSGSHAPSSVVSVQPKTAVPIPATSSSASDGADRTAAPDGAFSVVLPAGWDDSPSDAKKYGLTTAYLGPTTSGFSANVNVTNEDAQGLDLAAYQRAALGQLQKRLKVSRLSAATHTTVGGDDALVDDFYDTQNGEQLHQRQTVVVHGGTGYVITFTALPTAYDSAAKGADAIIASWQWGS